MPNPEIKSVLRMGRKFQFASDSLRIDLTPLLEDFRDFHVSSSYGTVQEVTALTYGDNRCLGGTTDDDVSIASKDYQTPQNCIRSIVG
ncbi:unnamed protein product [Caenorhabditis brenneri]